MRLFPFLIATLSALALTASLFAQQPSPGASSQETTGERDRATRLVYKTTPGEHLLQPTLRLGQEAIKRLEKVKDYSCTFVKRERVDGQLKDHEYWSVKVRHRPFSVYIYSQAPRRGSEVIYFEGKNNGQLWAHEVGAGPRFVGTLSLDPDGPRARKESRHPITKAGMLNLSRRIAEMAERDSQYGECEVKTFPDAKVNSRHCLSVQITHPVPRREFRFHLARIYFDHEWGIPIRYEAYTWPKKPGGEPELFEEYTFVDLKFDNGFSDRDFDIANPSYNFPPER